MIDNLSDLEVSRITEGILRRAYEDYYTTCIVPRKLPKRPKVKDVYRGKTVERFMTDNEYHLYLVGEEQARKNRRTEVLAFFQSEWYAELTDREMPYDRETRRILELIKQRRLNNIPLFDSERRKERTDD